MRGLRTQESKKFNRFFQMIQDEAAKIQSVFFADCGEGNDLVTDTLECEDMRGWLIPDAQADEFEKIFLNSDVGDEWLDLMCWAEWEKQNDIISVKFNWY